jgi:hypothetical protein
MIDALLSDMSFKLIEREYVKRARKRGKDPLGDQEYRIYLEALVKRIQEVVSVGTGAEAGATDKPGSKREAEAPLRGSDIIPNIGNPEAAVNRELIRKECEKHKGKNGFSLSLPDGWVGVSDIQVWLKDMGLPFEVGSMEAPQETVAMAAGKGDGGFGLADGMTGNTWRVNFVRI